MNTKIYYTLTDESPFLATQSLLPIVRGFAKTAGIDVETKNISLPGRILAAFADTLPAGTTFAGKPVTDDLAFLGKLTLEPDANIIKLPNISASVPQLKAAIAELQKNGYALPDYPDAPATDEEKAIRARYDKVKGSAVNPVLRQGNSDRRAPNAVKNYARNNPHSNGVWNESVKTFVASMRADDFYGNEKSVTMAEADTFKIEFVSEAGDVTELRAAKPLLKGEIIDATVMRMASLEKFIADAMAEAKAKGLLFSVHLKATMMKVSDPVLFGAFVRVFFKDVFTKYADLFKELGIDANNGLGDLFKRLEGNVREAEVRAAIDAALAAGPDLAMVDSAKGVTNLHVPSDVIIDASMPAMIRNSGCMWNKEGNRDHHGQTQSAFADDAAQRCTDEEEDKAGDAQGELLMPFLFVLVDVFVLCAEVQFVECCVVFGILGASESHVDKGCAGLAIIVVQQGPSQLGAGVGHDGSGGCRCTLAVVVGPTPCEAFGEALLLFAITHFQ